MQQHIWSTDVYRMWCIVIVGMIYCKSYTLHDRGIVNRTRCSVYVVVVVTIIRSHFERTIILRLVFSYPGTQAPVGRHAVTLYCVCTYLHAG